MNLFNFFRKKQVPPEQSDLIYRPDEIQYQHLDVEKISLTPKEAIQKGFSFRWKSKSVRITNYHGNTENLIIPSMIGDKKVNEIGAKAFFRNPTVKKLQIPSSIKKIGVSAFQESRLECCLFADGLAYIPENAFQDCKFLSEVHLPWNVAEIRKNAFYGCKSLSYIEFPLCCYTYGDGTFASSGLEGFGYEKSYYGKNGLAFTNTPLWENYALILSENKPDCMKVLMIGLKTAKSEFQVPPGKVFFGMNAFTGKNASYLDLTKCKEITFFRSFSKNFSVDSSRHCTIPVVLRFPEHYQNRVQLPCVMVKTYLGTKQARPPLAVEHHNGIMTVAESSQSRYLNETDIPDTTTLTIKGNTGFLHFIEKEAFNYWRLKEVIIEVPFHALGNLFSKRCTSLCKMQWTEKDRIITKYIPPAELIWNIVHDELLKAFAPAENHFFDSRVILDMFQKKSIKVSYWDSEHYFNIHTRQRVLIAIDALRSTPRDCDVNTDIYLIYLKRHIKKARQVCEKIKDKYPEYLEFLNTLEE